MRYEITPEISDYIKNCIGVVPGTCKDICERHAIPQAILSRILHGTKPGVDEDTWLALCNAFPCARSMAKPYARTTKPKPAVPGTVDSFRLRLTDAVLKEPRLDDRSKMLVLQLVAEAAHGS